MKTGLAAAAAIATIGTGGLIGAQAVSAESGATTSTDPMSSLVDKLVSKFNLNKTDVQKIFDESRTEMEAKREEEQSARLQKLADAGTITAEQKTKIEAKLKELKASREPNKDSTKDLTDNERKTKRESERTTLEAWAKQNGIDLTKIGGVMMGQGHRGPGGPGGQKPDTTE